MVGRGLDFSLYEFMALLLDINCSTGSLPDVVKDEKSAL
jgi:hypothetical protein